MLRYLLYRLGQLLTLALPLKLGYAIAILISDLRFIFASKDKKAVSANLRIIFPEKTNKQIQELMLKMFRNFAKYLVDFFRFSLLNEKYIKKHIRIENLCFVDEARKKNKGVILLTAHIGNWELGGVVVSLLGYPFWAVALPHKHKLTNDFFNAQRESKGMKVIPLGKAVKLCLATLKKNELLALVGDRDFGSGHEMIVEFFGKRTSLPKGPAAFSLMTTAPIVPGFMVRNPDNSFTLRFEKPIQTNDLDCYNPNDAAKKLFKPDEALLEELAGRYKTVIEDYIRKYPDQWYVFKQFWI